MGGVAKCAGALGQAEGGGVRGVSPAMGTMLPSHPISHPIPIRPNCSNVPSQLACSAVSLRPTPGSTGSMDIG